jgi:hypothetical protein
MLLYLYIPTPKGYLAFIKLIIGTKISSGDRNKGHLELN